MGSGLVVALDPGTAEAGLAVFEDGELSSAWLSRSKKRHWVLMARQAYVDLISRYPLEALAGATLILEVPQVYRNSVGKDLIKLAQMGGAFAAYLAHDAPITVKSYLPKEWKGNVKKEIMTERIKERLTPEEHSRIELPRAKSLHHNIYDGCGLGLKFLGRLR
jgi:hypothetical protein